MCRRFARHGSSFKGEELKLEVHTTGVTHLTVHSNETLGRFRDSIARMVDVADNYFHVYVDNRYLGPELNAATLGELDIFPESVVVVSFVAMNNDAPLPCYVQLPETNMSMEQLLPAHRLAHRADLMDRLFELTELPFPAIQTQVAKLLRFLPTDPVELQRTLARVKIGSVSDANTHLVMLCLKCRTPFRRTYNLQLLSSLIQPSKITPAVQTQAMQFRQAFVDANGPQILIDVLASAKEPCPSDVLAESSQGWLVALRILRFLLWKGIHLDIKVLSLNPSLEAIKDPDQKNEFFRKIAQEQRQTLAIERVLTLPSKQIFDALLNMIWRSSVGNWRAKTLQELAESKDPYELHPTDVWLAHESCHLLALLMQLNVYFTTYFSDFTFFLPLHRDVLLRCLNARIRWAFYTQPLETTVARMLDKLWPTLLDLLPQADAYGDSCKEFFDYLCHICARVAEDTSQDMAALLTREADWIQVCLHADLGLPFIIIIGCH